MHDWDLYIEFLKKKESFTVYSAILKDYKELIIHIPNAAFKDNSHACAFVAEVCFSAKAYKVFMVIAVVGDEAFNADFPVFNQPCEI